MLRPDQIAKILQKEADMPDALKRDPLTNYFEGYFFVTLNTRNEAPILSSISGHVGGEGADAPHCAYTELGQKVKEAWERNPQFYPGVEVIACEVMPEHFHGLLRLNQGNKQHLGRIIHGFMIGCTHAYWLTLGIDRHSMPYVKGVRTSEYNDADHTRSFRGPALFVRGYNDVEPITPEQVQIKIEYIRKQAEKRLIKREHNDRFTIYRHQHSRNWTADVALRAIASDPFFARNAQACAIAQQKVLASLNDGIDYLGNREWLASEKKLPLICHRADKALFDKQKQAVLEAARSGYVIVSAFISPGEREIRKQLLMEQLPVIDIMDNGFAERYKPTGTAFYACGENRLVQLSCWTYQYQKDNTISRETCLVMNELARVISKQPDEWWKRRHNQKQDS